MTCLCTFVTACEEILRSKVPRIWGVVAAAMLFATSTFGQDHCRDGYETQSCPITEKEATAPIKPVFAPTGWKTVALDHIIFEMPDYRKEAAFYIALMGWKLRSDDGRQAVLDIGDWGSAIFKESSEQRSAEVTNFCFVIEPWNAKGVESELRKRGLRPVAENGGKGFESFHCEGSRWMGPSDQEREWIPEDAQGRGGSEPRDTETVYVYRMEDNVDRPSLVSRDQLQGKRVVLFESIGLERNL